MTIETSRTATLRRPLLTLLHPRGQSLLLSALLLVGLALG
jgi:hypothetical protein